MTVDGLEYREFKTVAEYEKSFRDADFWRPYVDAALEQVGLPRSENLEHPGQGSNIVFLVDGRYFVKLFTNVLNGPQQKGIERLALETFDAHSELLAPRLLGTGELFPSNPWPWEFVITEKLEGTNIEHLWKDLDKEQKEEIARYIGRYLRALHSIPVSENLSDLIAHRMGRESFLEKWIDGGEARCIRLGIPPHLAKLAPAYVEVWRPSSEPKCILHGDLTSEHVFGISHHGKWRTTAIIDYGDLKLGNPLYDFVAVHLGTFYGDRRLLAFALDSYGGLPGFEPNAMLALSLVHEWDVLRESFEDPMLARSQSLEEVATRLWSLP